ncbi:MAG TPA: ATP-binding protein [Actinomycetota bacterium]|nr:ATP-binding protein [Actinomycetota bacterium]
MSTSSRVVSSHATAFGEARRFVRANVGTVPTRVIDDAVLLTSELVTNAVRHAGLEDQDEIEVTVSVDSRILRITVRDRGPGFDPEAVVRRRSDEGGWGLDLLRRLSSRWSVDRGDAGTDVWFEIDLPDESGT